MTNIYHVLKKFTKLSHKVSTILGWITGIYFTQGVGKVGDSFKFKLGHFDRDEGRRRELWRVICDLDDLVCRPVQF